MFAVQLSRRAKVQFAVVALLVTALIAVFMASHPQRAHAASLVAVTCGQTITVSTTLTSDIGPCSGDGLIIGKAGITLNLGGHTISGDQSANQRGVRIANVSTVTITNGKIHNFDLGVGSIGTVNSSKINALRVDGYLLGGIGINGSTNVISGNTVFSPRTACSASVQCSGISVAGVTGNQVTNNIVQSANIGIFVSSAKATTISGNKVTSSVSNGIELFFPSGTVLTGNFTMSNGAAGIQAYSDQTAKFTNNTSDYNTGLGISAGPGSADGSGNKAQDNGNVKQCANVVCLPV